jgi:hypothetical protein
MTKEELEALQKTLGKQASEAMKLELEAYETKMKSFATEVAKNNGGVTKEAFDEYKKAAEKAVETVKEIAEKQGTTLSELAIKMNSAEIGTKSIGDTLKDDFDELRKVYEQGSGSKQYMLNVNEKGQFVMKPHNQAGQKTVGPVASVSGINGGTAASIFQSIDAASLLRLGGDSSIISQYRNSAWVFDLCNIVNASYETLMAMWYEEVAKTGASTTVAEGVSKPLSQYAYTLKTATYKKEATLIGFTEEFSLDFARLQSDILGKGRTDVINRINTAVLANIIAAATAYNTGTSYKNGAVVSPYNDYIAIDAAAAQVDNATFGQKANAAVMSTFKNHRVNTQMDTQGRFIDPPQALKDIAMVGNPAMATDDLLVGDFKQYNIILRGGLIVRVGYNGTDFAQNMFSTVLEQYYYDYISAVRAVAIVKGQTFAAIKTAVTT